MRVLKGFIGGLVNSRAKGGLRGHASGPGVRGIMCVLGVVLGVLACGEARGTTFDGTLLSNVATASYFSPTGYRYWVSYSTTATVVVVNPCLQLSKVGSPTVASSGGTVTWQIYVKNCSPTTSAYNVVMYDVVPDNMAYVGSSYAANIFGGVPAPTVKASYSLDGGLNWLAGEAPGGVTALLRWGVTPSLAPNVSAMITFKATVL